MTCVYDMTSGCSYDTRSSVMATFNSVHQLVQGLCSGNIGGRESDVCPQDADTRRCDVEEALMCLVPVQAMMIQANASIAAVCGYSLLYSVIYE